MADEYDDRATFDLQTFESGVCGLLERSVADTLDGRPAGVPERRNRQSTIAGFLAKISGRPARTFSIGFAADGYDEIEYARIAARHFTTEHHEYYVTPDDVLTLAPRLAEFCDQPFGNASAVPTYYCAKLAGGGRRT